MEAVTIQHIHNDILELKKIVINLSTFIEENFKLADDLIEEINKSRGKLQKEMISHTEMRKEFG